ncbi:hypothetical protein [Xanthobacter sediminis]
MAQGLMDYIPDYLRNSWDGLARGAKAVREATDPFQYARPAAQAAASMLPGAGLVQGSQDFQSGRQALGDGRYGDAAMDYGLGLINAGTDMVPAMAGLPPVRRGLMMDEASRMARARDLGYSDEPFYRGEASGRAPVEFPERVNYFSRDKEYSTGFAQRGGESDPRLRTH